MPRPSKGARLYKRKARYSGRKLVHQAVWIIKDGDRHIGTGCVAGPSETKPPAEAEQALANYIAQKYQPERRRQDIEDIDCADVLSIYLTDIGEPGEQFEIEARIERLNEFWGGKKLLAVNAQTCAHNRDVYFVSLMDISCARSPEEKLTDDALEMIKNRLRFGLRDFSYVGMVEPAYYVNLQRGVRYDGNPGITSVGRWQSLSLWAACRPDHPFADATTLS
jgi:hypothetical protein